MSADGPSVLLLRLAGPLQSWGAPPSEFSRRDTRPEPTKSGILGLLAAAKGLPRTSDISDLLKLKLGVRIDQRGSLLRDYHTVSDLYEKPLLSANVSAKGAQKPTSPAKHTYVTQRFYLQDAVFVAAIGGPRSLIEDLGAAVRRPAFPLALGRRSCVPARQVFIDVQAGHLMEALKDLPWQASQFARQQYVNRLGETERITLPITVDDEDGKYELHDVPISFDPMKRGFTYRRVRQGTISDVPVTLTDLTKPAAHDPYDLWDWG